MDIRKLAKRILELETEIACLENNQGNAWNEYQMALTTSEEKRKEHQCISFDIREYNQELVELKAKLATELAND